MAAALHFSFNIYECQPMRHSFPSTKATLLASSKKKKSIRRQEYQKTNFMLFHYPISSILRKKSLCYIISFLKNTNFLLQKNSLYPKTASNFIYIYIYITSLGFLTNKTSQTSPSTSFVACFYCINCMGVSCNMTMNNTSPPTEIRCEFHVKLKCYLMYQIMRLDSTKIFNLQLHRKEPVAVSAPVRIL